MTTASATVDRRTSRAQAPAIPQDPVAQFKSEWTKAASSYAAGLQSAFTRHGCLPMGTRMSSLWCVPSAAAMDVVDDRMRQIASARGYREKNDAIFDLGQIYGLNSVETLLVFLLETADYGQVYALIRAMEWHLNSRPAPVLALARHLAPVSDQGPVSTEASRLLLKMGPQIIPILESHMKDGDAYQAARALTLFGDTGAPIFEKVLKNGDWETQSLVLRAMNDAKYRPSVQLASVLVGLLETESSAVSSRAASALSLSGIQDPHVISALLRATRHKYDLRLREAAILAIGVLGAGNSEAIVTLWTIIERDWDEDFRPALKVLAEIGHNDPESAKRVYRLAKDASHPRRQESALAALGRMRPVSSEAIQLAVDNMHGENSWHAQEALAHMGSIAVPAVMAELDSWFDSKRESAINALRRMGGEAAAALPALRHIMKDPEESEDIRWEAHWAVTAIQSPNRSLASSAGGLGGF